MNNHYLIFKRVDNEDFIGFSKTDPTKTSGKIYNYIKVSEEDFKKAIKQFESDNALFINDDKTSYKTKINTF